MTDIGRGSRSTVLVKDEKSYVDSFDCPKMTDTQIDQMVNRFLSWKLPTDFNPDGGITFTPEHSIGTPFQGKFEPTGTNLLTYTQAKAMVIHMLGEPT